MAKQIRLKDRVDLIETCYYNGPGGMDVMCCPCCSVQGYDDIETCYFDCDPSDEQIPKDCPLEDASEEKPHNDIEVDIDGSQGHPAALDLLKTIRKH